MTEARRSRRRCHRGRAADRGSGGYETIYGGTSRHPAAFPADGRRAKGRRRRGRMAGAFGSAARGGGSTVGTSHGSAGAHAATGKTATADTAATIAVDAAADRQQAWEIPQAHVGQVVRTIEMGGRLWHQQSVTWTWPASMETEDAPEAREEAEAIGWRTPDQESCDPGLRARAEGKRPEKEVPREESPGEANPEKREWSWPAPGEALPPPRLPRQTSCPEAGQTPPRPCHCRQASLDGQK
ncbi:uncharacterized protein LOC120285632 [Drosophila simulans]|uniref:uncharacterized protein LOC120285632 n=1 Tax=Drosophila simulans TaxID=7240 RepID=UPI001D123555|nr:uncharacterized protein LOC120285632 [Drosophila simulans]